MYVSLYTDGNVSNINIFVSRPAPPKVVSVESSVMAPLGIDTELACRAIGIPRPFVQWHKNGILVNDSYKYEQLSFTYRHHTTLAWLRIRSLSRKDFGQYVCMASNDFGKQETTIILAGKIHIINRSTNT